MGSESLMHKCILTEAGIAVENNSVKGDPCFKVRWFEQLQIWFVGVWVQSLTRTQELLYGIGDSVMTL